MTQPSKPLYHLGAYSEQINPYVILPGDPMLSFPAIPSGWKKLRLCWSSPIRWQINGNSAPGTAN